MIRDLWGVNGLGVYASTAWESPIVELIVSTAVIYRISVVIYRSRLQYDEL